MGIGQIVIIDQIGILDSCFRYLQHKKTLILLTVFFE